jgi:hypothetical protein
MNPTAPQNTTTPPPPFQQQQATNPGIPWSTRVQTYGDYLAGVKSWWTDTPIEKLKRAEGRRLAIAYIGPEPVPLKAGPYKSPEQLAEEARVAKQALDREIARMDEIGRVVAAAKNPVAASQAEYAQRVLAFGNAPAVTPPSTVPKPLSVRAPIARTLETAAYQEDIAVAALREAIAKGAVLASIVKKASSNKNNLKKPTGSKSGSKKPLTIPKN